jgi:cytochrome oxidase Cu insertion factor (SCO1/SenC/PrrC family)
MEGCTMTKRWIGIWVLMLFSAFVLLGNAASATALKVGDKAPDFSLPATSAEKISLSDYLGKKPVVVFFYVNAFSGL